ncbi:hypothetical protein ACFYWN_37355 [Streptomyces sp. NPDC002917]|uniref:hypothetical protein n=1 Tax=Streptomyces sp. NPDC002917 TaxID=3364671 RepID=UPI0036C92F88
MLSRSRILRRAYGLPDDFDIHDPQNLAPICTLCNGAENKGNSTYDAPIVVTRLKTAEKHRATVIARVQKFGQSGRVAAHLLEAATADLSDPGLRQEFLDHAPTVVQILAMMDPRLVDYQSFRELEVDVCEETGNYQRIDVTLNGRGRTAASLLEEVCETELADALQDPVVQLIGEIHDRVTAGFEATEAVDPITAGPPTPDFITLDADSLDFSRFAGGIEFTFDGTFEAGLSASLVRSSSDGGGTDELQGDAVVSGTFSIVAVWDLTADPADVSAGDCPSSTGSRTSTSLSTLATGANRPPTATGLPQRSPGRVPGEPRGRRTAAETAARAHRGPGRRNPERSARGARPGSRRRARVPSPP